MQKQLLSIVVVLFIALNLSANQTPETTLKMPFEGMWGLDIEGGGVGWLHVHQEQGFLDAELLWIGGSVLPVSNVYLADENTLVVTRSFDLKKVEGRTHLITSILRIEKDGDDIKGTMTEPSWDGVGETTKSFTVKRMPPMPKAPDLSKVKYGKLVTLFNGKDLTGWELINPNHVNGFKIVDGTLVNEPEQPKEGEHKPYGNVRTKEVFKDFNLKLEVNVPAGNNSGVYLRGLYEIQVVDSYGKDLDSHNMGALYSRIKPSTGAEKIGGEWQTLNITLVDRHVTVILNGKMIIDNQPVLGPTGGAISTNVLAPGPIYLQGDHGKVSYRNIVLTPVL